MDSKYFLAIAGWAALSLNLSRAQPLAPLSGKVTWLGNPVREAYVTWTGAGLSTLTDSLGRYRFDGTASLIQGPQGPRLRGMGQADAEDLRRLDGRWSAGLPEGTRASAVVYERSGRSGSGGNVSQPVNAGNPGRMARPGLAKSSGPGSIKVSARGYRDTASAVSEGLGTLDIVLTRDYRRHLWIWGNTVATSAKERDSLFAFARRKDVGTLYLDCGGIIGNAKDVLGNFLDSAHAHGLAVELLFGAPEWALARNHDTPVGLARQTVALVESLRKQGRAPPTSIQMDVEPHSLPEWTDDPAGTSNQFIDMYEKLAAVLKGTGIGVTACIPRWLDERMVLRKNRTRPLSDWLADSSDRLALMDYVDNAKGIIAGAAHEIAYADSTGKEVIIGVETIPGLDPPGVTFAEAGEAAMNAALTQTMDQYKSHRSFFGVAVHHWGTYPSMKP